jgi:hypothetical protein
MDARFVSELVLKGNLRARPSLNVNYAAQSTAQVRSRQQDLFLEGVSEDARVFA